MITNSRRTMVAVLLSAVVLVPIAAAVTIRDDGDKGTRWRLLEAETFDDQLPIDAAAWVQDPNGVDSPWHVDGLDDDGEVWNVISGPSFEQALETFDVYRKRVRFGEDGWLTAEIAAQDKDKNGSPDSHPTLRRTMLNGD